MTTDKIYGFQGNYRFLSNFYPSPIMFPLGEGNLYPTAEHLYQSGKTNVESEKEIIRLAESPKIAKSLGFKMTLRPDWEENKLSWMSVCVLFKFCQNKDLSKKLIETERMLLIEANSWKDTFWGVDETTGQGNNHLGKILMHVRSLLKDTTTNDRDIFPQTWFTQ